jgi:rhamnulose-1-phosphate aldolase
VPQLAGRVVLATGGGRRLGGSPAIRRPRWGRTRRQSGATATCHLPRRHFRRLTSELNSHLQCTPIGPFATYPLHVVHAQPLQLTLLSHIPEYRVPLAMSRRLFRWEPETLINLPEGIGVLEFMLPGSAELQAATLAALRRHRLVVWSKHGVMARSDESVTRVVDYIEYVETAARYELLDGSTGNRAEGLTADDLHRVVEAFAVPTELF